MIELLKHVPKPIAYVLGGGGAYGSIHVGQLRALAKTDLRPDFVVGTSVGSLNATIVAETPEIAHDRLAAFWSLVTREDVFGSARKMMVNLAALRPAIADPTPLREMLLRSTPSRDFSDLQLPLTAVAADVTTGHHVELNSGDLISALFPGGRPRLPFRTGDPMAARRSIRVLLALGPEWIYAAHGGPWAGAEVSRWFGNGQ